ncbi:alpha/beta fold hydrolase [Metabacillus herbersteinensis]|uniref:Alpha/beta fold hydrolase n=1 Tax=Metabacillus herbersteinensis TaxID=283816 RepID=A0ABV6GKY5_9BACI
MERFAQNVGEDTISYLDQGVGDCLVLIHGFCGSHEYWKYIVPALTKEYRVLTIDLRGHGGSSTTKNGYNVSDMADDIENVIAALEIERVSIIGHSLGGYVALAFAEKYPEKLNRLALIHSTAFADSEEGKANRLKGINKIESEGIIPFIDDLVPKLFAKSSSTASNDQLQFVKKIGYKTAEFGAIGGLEAMKNRLDRNDVLTNLTIPVLIVAGSEDQLISPEKSFSVKSVYITEVTIEKCGHMSMIEQPDLLAEHLLFFLKNSVRV